MSLHGAIVPTETMHDVHVGQARPELGFERDALRFHLLARLVHALFNGRGHS
jgi:hypothetical protein